MGNELLEGKKKGGGGGGGGGEGVEWGRRGGRMLQILTREEGDQNAMRSDGGVRAVNVRVIPRDSVSKTRASHVHLRLSQV